jgi:nicotinate phosphoribosyltransferase
MMVNVFNPSLALLTDLYQLTMAYGYWKNGTADREACFHLHFRKPPFSGGYAIACGLASVIDFVKKHQFGDGDLAYLAQLQGADGKPLFDRAFCVYLRRMRFNLEIDAVPEGTAVFGDEPLVRVKGPLLQCQIVETALLNMINFNTLIATKSARVCQAAQGDAVLEFGLRRAQGVDGAISASRAAFVGGCAATSNVLAGKFFGIPVKGTHAHSWVMSFDSELEAFDAYARAMPNNCIFLVDTYDTIQGVRNAITVGHKLRERGHELQGIRLDSGDLAYLSIEARRMLDEAGFPDAKILASNDLDEYLIADLKQQGATISVWGVGTRLVTAYDQPALGGVYKLSALRDADKQWRHKIKLSEQSAKISIPGIQQVRRYRDDAGVFIADAIYDTLTGIGDGCTVIDPADMTRRKVIHPGTAYDDLLVPVFRDGKCVYDQPPLPQIRQRTLDQLAALHGSVKRFKNPHRYPAGLEQKLFDIRNELILEARGFDVAKEQPQQPQTPAASPWESPAPATPSAESQPKVEVEVTRPQRPRFAGIGAKHGQAPQPGSNVRVNPNRRGGGDGR